MASPRRRIALLVFCVVMGAALNVAVAWGCAIWSETADMHGASNLSRSEAVELLQKYGPKTADWMEETGYRWKHFGNCLVMATGAAGYNSPRSIYVEAEYGFPMTSLYGGVWFPNAQEPKKSQNFNAFAVRNSWINLPRSLPTGLIYDRFVINTIFYFAFIWMLIRGPWETRRRWRELHGRCGVCGYPHGVSSVCTECGADFSRAWKPRLAPQRIANDAAQQHEKIAR